MKDPIERLADQLMTEGHFDDQADARLAAVHFILRRGCVMTKPRGGWPRIKSTRPGGGRAVWRALSACG